MHAMRISGAQPSQQLEVVNGTERKNRDAGHVGYMLCSMILAGHTSLSCRLALRSQPGCVNALAYSNL
jgi:hypothetical protein